VDYDGLQLSFTDQVITEHMMDGGDSGSLGLDMNKNLWGLGFAGSDELTVFNKISNLGIVAPALPLFDLRKFIGIGLFVGLFLKTKGVL
jgi:hypothetical protein